MEQDPIAYKAWMQQQKEYLELSQRAPLQSAIARADWDPVAIEIFEKHFDSFFSVNSHEEKGEAPMDMNMWRENDEQCDAAVNIFFRHLQDNDNEFGSDGLYDPIITKREVIDTLSEFEVLSGHSNPEETAENSGIAKKARAVVPAVPPRESTPAVVASATTSSTSAHNNLKSRFKSAKQKYGEEVGDIYLIL